MIRRYCDCCKKHIPDGAVRFVVTVQGYGGSVAERGAFDMSMSGEACSAECRDAMPEVLSNL